MSILIIDHSLDINDDDRRNPIIVDIDKIKRIECCSMYSKDDCTIIYYDMQSSEHKVCVDLKLSEILDMICEAKLNDKVIKQETWCNINDVFVYKDLHNFNRIVVHEGRYIDESSLLIALQNVYENDKSIPLENKKKDATMLFFKNSGYALFKAEWIKEYIYSHGDPVSDKLKFSEVFAK